MQRLVFFHEGVFPEYKLPFEEEVGLHPSIEAMQDVVVDKKLRPKIRGEWRAHKVRLSEFSFEQFPQPACFATIFAKLA